METAHTFEDLVRSGAVPEDVGRFFDEALAEVREFLAQIHGTGRMTLEDLAFFRREGWLEPQSSRGGEGRAMIDRELALKVVDLLTSIHAADPAALAALVATRVPCNRALADHPAIQVDETDDGFLGALNGLCGVDRGGRGAVAVLVEEDGAVTGVQLLEERCEPTE